MIPEHREIIASLVALAASFVLQGIVSQRTQERVNAHLVVDNVFSDIVVDFFQGVWVSSSPEDNIHSIFVVDVFGTSPVHGHDDDCSEDDGEDDEDGDEEVEVHVQGGEGAHELHVTVLLRRHKVRNQEQEDGRCPP